MTKPQSESQAIRQAAVQALPQHLDLEVWYEDIAIWVICAYCGATWFVNQDIDPHTYQYHYRFTPAFTPPAPFDYCNQTQSQ